MSHEWVLHKAAGALHQRKAAKYGSVAAVHASHA